MLIRTCIIVLLALTCIDARRVHAAEYSYSVFSDLTYSNNITRRVQEESGTALTNGASANYSVVALEEWELDFAASFSNIDYSSDNLRREKRKSLMGSAFYLPRSSNFSLFLLESISQVPQNRFSIQDVNNVRDVESTTIQPAYFFNLSPTDRINLEATYIDLTNDQDDLLVSSIDGSRVTEQGSIGYQRQINPLNRVSFIGESEQTTFDAGIDDGVLDFDQEDVFLRWEYISISTQLQIDYGRSKLSNELEQTEESDLYSFLLTRQLSAAKTLSLTSSKGFNNLLRSNIGAGTAFVDDELSDFGTASEVKDSSLNYSSTGLLFESLVSLTYKKIGSTVILNTQRRMALGLSTTYYLFTASNTPLDSNLTFDYSLSKNEFDTDLSSVNRNDVELIAITYNHGYASAFAYYVRLEQRNTSQNNRESGDSTSISVGFSYAPLGRDFRMR